MTNSRAASVHPWKKLATHRSTGTEASKTIAITGVDTDDYACFKIIITGEPTATLAMLMQINTLVDATYFVDGIIYNAGNGVAIDINTATSWEIASTNVCQINTQFSVEVTLYIGNSSYTDERPTIHAKASGGQVGESICGTYSGTPTNTLTEIKILTSTSTWKADTTIVVYGLKL